MTRYLQVVSDRASEELTETLRLNLEIYVPDVSLDMVTQALSRAADNKIEGWDGYLVELATRYASQTVYTIDRRFARVPGVKAVVPVSEPVLVAYHEWVSDQLGRVRWLSHRGTGDGRLHRSPAGVLGLGPLCAEPLTGLLSLARGH